MKPDYYSVIDKKKMYCTRCFNQLEQTPLKWMFYFKIRGIKRKQKYNCHNHNKCQ